MAKTKENVARHILRLNMDNKHHVMIHNVIEGLDPNIYKSRTHFLVDAVDFFIENVGKESLSKPESSQYLTRNEVDQLKQEVIASAVNEAKNEVIKLLMGAAYSTPVSFSAGRVPMGAMSEPDVPEDDEIIADNAMKWFNEEQ